jgi:hypothetical protein
MVSVSFKPHGPDFFAHKTNRVFVAVFFKPNCEVIREVLKINHGKTEIFRR